MKKAAVRGMLFGLSAVMRRLVRHSSEFREFAARHDAICQVRLKDGSVGRFFIFSGGNVTSRAGIHPKPDVAISFKDAATAIRLMKLPTEYAESVHAAKNFRIVVSGDDEKIVWFSQLLSRIPRVGTRYGVRMHDGSMRYTNLSNGGPLFVYVKDGRIVRTCPIEFDQNDAKGWTISARGRKFSPDHKTTVAPHALATKSVVYSENRNLYPMKRVDFDPHGERNPQNRGVSGYERISWEEAASMVADEIRRLKRQYGPGAMALYPSSHQQWGNVNYWISSMLRFGNLVGFTRVHQNPDSWEGWYWGALHHFGNSMRVGLPGFYGLVE
ncbi:MAG TPA: pyrogallol hydroxytransferase large subunit, partial [Elusimicrobiota bacterium]|nr:pyrogallol hydroxytransferase large subunit [Elusimicrobiota bacterium]